MFCFVEKKGKKIIAKHSMKNKIELQENFYEVTEEEFNNIIFEVPTATPTLQDIDQQIIGKIREQYDINAEFKMINLGVADSTNAEYIAYRQHVEDCKEWGRLEKIKYGYIEE